MNQAGWLRAQVAEKGADLAAWPDTARAVALSLDAAAWDAAGIIQRGAAGGEAPRPYPDKGHLLDRPVQDAANRGAYAYDECPDAFDPLPGAASAVQDGTSSRDDDPRKAVEARRRATAGDPSAPAGERGRTWERRRGDRGREFELRAAVEAVTGRPIVDGKGRPLECNEDGMVYGHVRVVDAFRFRVHTCKARGRCPHCARAYALEQAAELRSLMAAAMDRRLRPLRSHDPLGWAFVVTAPRVVSDHLGRLADDPRERKALRDGVTRLVGVARDYIASMLGVEPSELGAAVNIHWWSSGNPTREKWHWHAHVMVPNVQKDGRELRRKAKFSVAALEKGRDVLAGLWLESWPELLMPAGAPALPPRRADRRRLRGVRLCRWEVRDGVFYAPKATAGADLEDQADDLDELDEQVDDQPAEVDGAADDEPERELLTASSFGLRVPTNAKARYYLADEKGARRWRHRARYDARHPFADLLKEIGTEAGRQRVFGDVDGVALERFALRVERLQSLKLRRYVGWLVPGRRKAMGLVREVAEEGAASEWYALPDGYRRIRGWTDRGLELARFDPDTGEVTTGVLAELVDFDSQGPPVRWSYEGARDATRKEQR